MPRIDRAGAYDLPADAYHADPCPEPSLSKSVAMLLLEKTPRHAWLVHPRLNPEHEREHKTAFDIGTVAHDLLLNGEGRFRVVEADDWRTKAAKEARDEAYAEGVTPLLAHQMQSVRSMVRSTRLQLDRHAQASEAFKHGKAEQTLVWQEDGIWCRCRLDWLPSRGNLFPDYKTTGDSANPEHWGTRQLFNLGGDLQAAWYRRGIKAALGIEEAHFWFVVQETAPPYALSVVAPTPAAIGMADRKVTEALRIWRWCLENDTWPGYPNHTAFVDPPAWQETRWLEREERAEVLKKNGVDLIQASIDWQAPLEKR